MEENRQGKGKSGAWVELCGGVKIKPTNAGGHRSGVVGAQGSDILKTKRKRWGEVGEACVKKNSRRGKDGLVSQTKEESGGRGDTWQKEKRSNGLTLVFLLTGKKSVPARSKGEKERGVGVSWLGGKRKGEWISIG